MTTQNRCSTGTPPLRPRAFIQPVTRIRSPSVVRASSTLASHRSEEHTSELQSHVNLVCRLLLEKKNLDDYIKIEQKNFFETQKETEIPLHIVFNPPYAERLDIDLERLDLDIGDTLEQCYPGTHT